MHKIKIAAPTALHEAKGVFSFAKENTPFGTPRERLRLAVSDLNDSYASGMGMPARGGAALSVAIRFASAPTIRCCAAVGGSDALRMRHTPCGCRSAHLVEVQPNFRLPSTPQCGERSNAAFRKQSAAEVTSLAPHDNKARLLSDHDSQGLMAKPCTPHPHCAACAVLQAANCQCAGSRGKAPCVLLGDLKGAILSRERMAPFARSPASRETTRFPRRGKLLFFPD